jgi:hypothetical protein
VAPTRESGVRTSSSSLWTQGRTAETPPVAVPYAGCRQAGRRVEPRHVPAAQSALPCRLPGVPPPGRASRFRPCGRAQVSPTSSLSSFFPLRASSSARTRARRRRSALLPSAALPGKTAPHPLRARAHAPCSSLNTTAPSPGSRTVPSPPRHGCGGQDRAVPVQAPGEAASGPIFANNRSRVSPRSFLASSPVHPGDELAGFWIFPPAMAPGGHIASSSIIPGSFP